jgi:sporulation-control protein
MKSKFSGKSVQVHMKLEKHVFQKGEEVEGMISIENGSSKRKVIAIFIELSTEKHYTTTVIGDYKVHDGFVLQPNEKKEIPFLIYLPEDGPLTEDGEQIQFITKVSLEFTFDAKDQTYIEIKR